MHTKPLLEGRPALRPRRTRSPRLRPSPPEASIDRVTVRQAAGGTYVAVAVMDDGTMVVPVNAPYRLSRVQAWDDRGHVGMSPGLGRAIFTSPAA